MNTTYKSRAWWLALALSYAESIVSPAGACSRQVAIWGEGLRFCMEAAVAPSDDERLTIIHRDAFERQRGAFEPSFV